MRQQHFSFELAILARKYLFITCATKDCLIEILYANLWAKKPADKKYEYCIFVVMV